ncbi:MAG: Modification methylase HhaI [Herbaspirillum frisingense]|uniref:DNA (cytosine-5-)-methyltransferase n=1 Tax=Herbaspirillum frisingense TaxID=92645 RepID=A0A7V8FVT9_9BURK|nr:MAG: Modification methylase HhaI [Herbaspirillum frisingense]
MSAAFKVVDLFAGAGGFTKGALMAGCEVKWAANHWPQAVSIHAANHPLTAHACQDLHQADWRTVPAHDLLLASPACQGHTPARGKEKPHHDAQRSTAWAVVSSMEYHRPAFGLVENVTNFANWALFPAWCAALHALGYAVSPHLIDSADHGVAQHRLRLFVVLSKSKNPVKLSLEKRPRVAAADIIDFRAGRWSPIERPGRAAATLRRIASGRAGFGDRFVMPYYGNGSGLTGRDIGRPLGTITTRARWGIVDGDHMRMLSRAENIAAMGFPANYILPASDREAQHMLGNAVVPQVACDLITALAKAA